MLRVQYNRQHCAQSACDAKQSSSGAEYSNGGRGGLGASPPAVKAPAIFMELDDAALDNPTIAEDEKIMPARKCGFCMG